MRRIQWGRVAAVTAVFTLIGPLIGFMAALGWSIHQIPADEPKMRSLMLLSGFFTVIVAYIVGAPMALLTGLIAGLVSPRVRSGVLWVVAATALGALAALLLYRLVSPGMDRNLVVACAAIASLGCALATVAIRPRGTRPS
ncbi:hypothetical protein ACO2Q1_13195 [Brevundimonas sp. VNH65]|uniref:hypothetical protein n=1 Tax=Brevundimonas sp. VNH65 TaxID=3400917 RepID=UPI003C0D8605